MITSCKGGVGKSTVAANLAVALTRRSRRVLLCDLDLSNRSLDMFLGLEDRVLCDVCDLADRTAEVRQTLLTDETHPGLFFLPAPFRYAGGLTEERLESALDSAAAEAEADWILIDTSGGADTSVLLAAPLCGQALIVSLPEPCAMRAAEKSALLLDDSDIAESRLILNGLDIRKRSAAEEILSAIDRVGVPILGVIPQDAALRDAQRQGKTVFDIRKAFSRPAMENLAGRLDGESIPLLRGYRRRHWI